MNHTDPVTNQTVPPSQQYDYRRIASAHRLSTWSILLYLCGGLILALIQPEDIRDNRLLVPLIWLLAMGACIYSIVCMVQLAKSLQFGTGAILGFVLCIFPGGLLTIPLFIPLFCVYYRARVVLQCAGYRVGVVGADMRQFGDTVLTPEWFKTLLFWTSVVGFLFVFVFLCANLGREARREVSSIFDGRKAMPSPIDITAIPVMDIIGNAESTVPLPQTLQNDEYGFSFRFPEDWYEDTDEEERGLIAFVRRQYSPFQKNCNTASCEIL